MKVTLLGVAQSFQHDEDKIKPMEYQKLAKPKSYRHF
jgi:hypothetical protein